MQRKKVWAVAAALAGAVLSVAETPARSLAADHNDPIGVQATYRAGDSAAGYDVASGDPSADIADIFAWYNGPKGAPTSVVLALTWRADPIEAREKAFDPTVQYGIHVATGDKGIVDVSAGTDGLELGSKFKTTASHDITVWFGAHATDKGNWGVMVTGLPGIAGSVVGPVGQVLEPKPGVKIAAGLFDDPFFADLDSFFNAISVALGNKPGANPSLPLDRFSPINPKTQNLVRPFGYPQNVDGFGKQNMHAVVIELPAAAFGSRKLHVWGTTARKKGLAKSGRKLACTFDPTAGTYDCADKGAQP
jgi:hypothetical protein